MLHQGGIYMDNDKMEKFIDFLERSFRKSTIKSYSDLAEKADVDRSYLSMIINHKRPNPPSPEIIERLARVLEVDYNDMMKAAGYIKVYERPSDKEIETSKKVKILKGIFDELEIDYLEVIDEAKAKGLTPQDLKALIKISDQFKGFSKKD